MTSTKKLVLFGWSCFSSGYWFDALMYPEKHALGMFWLASFCLASSLFALFRYFEAKKS